MIESKKLKTKLEKQRRPRPQKRLLKRVENLDLLVEMITIIKTMGQVKKNY